MFDSESLDEQDAAEVATVHGKLEDLQHARRDFVMAVAHVGGNAVQLAEEERPRYIYRLKYYENNKKLQFYILKHAINKFIWLNSLNK